MILYSIIYLNNRFFIFVCKTGQIGKTTKALVVLVILRSKDFVPVAEILSKLNITEKTWIGSFAWFSMMHNPLYSYIFDGAIGLGLRQGLTPGLQDFLQSLQPQLPGTLQEKSRRNKEKLSALKSK